MRELTRHQTAILLAYARCGSIETTANELKLSPSTIRGHLSSIYKKLDVASGVSALYVWATINLDGGKDLFDYKRYYKS